MRVQGKHFQTIWVHPEDSRCIQIIDQRQLPHRFVVEDLKNYREAITAIKDMHVRGAPLIGVTAAFAVYLAALEIGDSGALDAAAQEIAASRPTAINLNWAIERQRAILRDAPPDASAALLKSAHDILQFELDCSRAIGKHGVALIEKLAAEKNGPVNVLTHCNAGWLACIDYGTATAPLYVAQERNIPLHVWVDETRPRNQGASLTAWELLQENIAHTVIADNAGGHLMQIGKVDMVIVGADRVTRRGDVANKIGTYLKALAAKDNNIPFYVALPTSTFDLSIEDGKREIPIEERSADEVRFIQGLGARGLETILLTPQNSPALNPAFDVTPAELVNGLITERGIVPATTEAIARLF